ncbi:MAG: MucBP domain-containing protein [Bacilli bacterium]|nr:MucBP domain-containing protein [Bacilli bacterium]
MKKTLFFILSLLCNINLVSAKEKGKLDIYYINTFGDFLSEKVTIEDEIGTSFNISPIEIEGYFLVRVDGTESGTFQENPQELYYMYDLNEYLQADNVLTGIEKFPDFNLYTLGFLVLILIILRTIL